jgi:hypothetical protein
MKVGFHLIFRKENIMGYDCSVTKRKGCNYCLRLKKIPSNFNVHIDDESKEIKLHLIDEEGFGLIGYFDINYCPICGREL